MKVTTKPVVDRLAFPSVRISSQEKALLGEDVTTEDGTGQIWCRGPGTFWWVVREDGTTFLTSTSEILAARSTEQAVAA